MKFTALLLLLCSLSTSAATITGNTNASITGQGPANTSSQSSSTNPVNINSFFTLYNGYGGSALAEAGGDPVSGHTFVSATIRGNYVLPTTATATVSYQRQFQFAQPFFARPLNWIPETMIGAGITSGRIIVGCMPPPGQPCTYVPPPLISGAGTGTITFEQYLNGSLLNSLDFQISVASNGIAVLNNSCSPQPTCFPLTIQRQDFIDNSYFYAPGQFIIGPRVFVPSGQVDLEYRITATATGTFYNQNGLEIRFADPVNLETYFTNVSDPFSFQTVNTASDVPEPATWAISLFGLLLLMRARRP